MNAITLISSIAIAVLAGVCTYLALPRFRATAMAICQKAFAIFSVLLYVILINRLVLLFVPDLVMVQLVINSMAFVLTVAVVTLVVVKHERTIKR